MRRRIAGTMLEIFASLLVVVFSLTLITPLQAQVTGTLSGYITDPTGAAVPNASVTATLVQQNVTRTVESNAEGFYNFAALAPGVYTLTAEKAGFEKLARTGVTLTVNQNVRVDMNLNLGALTQEVTVNAEAPLVDTRSPTVSGLVDDSRIVDLPLNGRNIVSLSEILPGVLNVSAPQSLYDARGGPTMNVNGGEYDMNNFMFD